MKLIKEISVIALASIVIALLYNYQRDNTLPLIFKPKEYKAISDDMLFRGITIDDSLLNSDTDDYMYIQQIEEIPIHDDHTPEYMTEKNSDSVRRELMQAEFPKNDSDKDVADNSVNEIKEEKKGKEIKLPNEKNTDVHDRTVTYAQIIKILENQDQFQLIDARHQQQFSEDKIGNAINIFPYNENTNEIVNKIYSLPSDKTYIIYCEGGECDSSHKLADLMINLGITNLYIYSGGWEEWIKNRGSSRP